MSEAEENSKFCTMSYAAERTGLALKTWYRGGAGTDSVSRIRFGRAIRLLRKEVDEFIAERVKKAEETLAKTRERS